MNYLLLGAWGYEGTLNETTYKVWFQVARIIHLRHDTPNMFQEDFLYCQNQIEEEIWNKFGPKQNIPRESYYWLYRDLTLIPGF